MESVPDKDRWKKYEEFEWTCANAQFIQIGSYTKDNRRGIRELRMKIAMEKYIDEEFSFMQGSRIFQCIHTADGKISYPKGYSLF